MYPYSYGGSYYAEKGLQSQTASSDTIESPNTREGRVGGLPELVSAGQPPTRSQHEVLTPEARRVVAVSDERPSGFGGPVEGRLPRKAIVRAKKRCGAELGFVKDEHPRTSEDTEDVGYTLRLLSESKDR
jgi:hypothetical protein